MSYTPEQVGRMSLYEFSACVDGWNKANSTEDTIEPPTAEEFEDAKAMYGD